MTARCKTCSSPHRDAANRDLLRGEPAGAVAERYGLNREGVRKHKMNHLKISTEAAQDAANAQVIVGYALGLYKRANAVLDTAESILATGEGGTKGVQAAAASLREVRASIELLSRLVVNDRPEDEGVGNAELDDLILAQLNMMRTPLELPPAIEDAQVVD